MKEGGRMNDHDIISEVRSKVDIVEVISSYLPLVQKGKNFFGVCPFHDDTNPSMSVSRELQIYRCFSCGASGNVFQFVMDYEHISFREALEMLAKRAGVAITGLHVKSTPSENDPYYEIYELAQKFYQNNLTTKEGRYARDYLKNRQIDDEMIKEFGIGLSLDKADTLVQLLKKKKYDLKTLNLIGLASQDHDTYIKRIMFPLQDLSGKVVGFSGRIYDNSNINKYLNTKETPIFKKGQLLYHYASCKEEVRQKHFVLVMEGFMDVIRASTTGLRNTVALMGTAMTKEQANLIKRLSNQIVLCFDGDDAGRHATLVNGEQFVQLGLNPRVVALEDDDDPDTYILKYGKERFLGLVENAISFQDYKIKSLKQGVNFNSPVEKAAYINQVLVETSKIKDEIEREIILKNLANECDIGYNTLEKRLLSLLPNEMPTEQRESTFLKEEKKTSHLDKYTFSERAILYYMLKDDKVVYQYEKSGIYFPDHQARYLASEISYYYKKYGIMNIADFYTYLSDKSELVHLLSNVLADELPDVDRSVIQDYFQVIHEYNRNQEIKRLQKMIVEEVDPLAKAKLGERIRKLKMGSEENAK